MPPGKSVNWAMVLTFSRLLAIPVFIYLFPRNLYAAMFLALLAGVTDVLDGYLARKYNWITDAGKLLDPLADKLLVLTVLYMLGRDQYISLVFFYFVLIKEIAMIIGSGILVIKGRIIAANSLGKAATAAFFAGILLVPFGWVVGYVFLYLAIALMVVAFGNYLMQFYYILTNKNS